MVKRTLYFGNPAYLSLKDEQLVVKFPAIEKEDSLSEALKEKAAATIPIEDIGVVVLDNRQITITQALLEKLTSNNCAIITCDSQRMPCGLLMPLESNIIQHERFTLQIEASLPLKKQLWQQTVAKKIANQVALLKLCTNCETANMMKWADSVRSGDSDNLEARAAAYYWANIFPNIPDFTRKRDGLPPNNLLNYGYAILRAVIARTLVAGGLLPTLGIHHHNRYNAYCLADDIMEPFRPFIDQKVIQTMKKFPDYAELSRDMKAELLQIPIIEVTIDGKRSPLMVAATTTINSLNKCFAGNAKKLIYPDL